MRVVIPTKDANGLSSRVTGHLGMAPYITVVDLDDGGRVVGVRHLENSAPGAGGGRWRVAQLLQELRPDALITHAIGPGAFYAIRDMGVRILRPKGHTVGESLEALARGELEELEGPTEDHHGRGHGHGHGRAVDAEELSEILGVGEGQSVLDLGCGDGYFSRAFASRGARATCVDLDDSHFQELREAGVEAIRADICGFRHGSYDLIFMSNVLHDVLRQCGERALDNVAAMARGRVAILEVKPESTFGPPPFLRLPREEVLRLFESRGFKLADERDLGNSYLLVFEAPR